MLVIRAGFGEHRALMDPSPYAELTDQERALLDFEREWWTMGTRKNDEIRARFDMSSSSYYRTLHGLIQQPAAMAYDPMTVLRLRRRREQARRDRIEGRRADPGSR